MYAPEFAYYRAGSVAEAGQLLKAHPGAKLLAGGHSLIPLLKLRLAAPPALIDIGRIAELKGISVKGGRLRIGALTTHADIAASKDVQATAPALAEAAAQIGDPAVRNRGTIGGSLAHADPASDLPTVLCALGGRVTAVGSGGERTIDIGDFFKGVMTTALGDDDLITSVEVQTAQQNQGTAYVKFPHPASRFAVVGAAAALTVKNGACASAAVAVGGVVPNPVRAASVEHALTGQSVSADALRTAAAEVSKDLGDDLLGDLYASADYRRAITPVYVERALTAAAARAR